MGLSDDDMAEDDFVGNLEKINWAIRDNACFVLLSDVPQFINSIVKQLKDDGIDYSAATYRNINFKMERAVSMWNPIKIELFMDIDVNSIFHRDETIIGYANADGSGFKWYPFREVVKTEKLNLTLLNGWTISGEAAVAIKVGDFININFIATGGVKTSGTVIFELPKAFRPATTRTIPLLTENNTTWARIAIYPSGQGRLWTTENIEGRIVCASGFSI